MIDLIKEAVRLARVSGMSADDIAAALANSPATMAVPGECPECHKYMGKCPHCYRQRPRPAGDEGTAVAGYAARLSVWKDEHHDCDCAAHESCGCKELREIIQEMECASYAALPSVTDTGVEGALKAAIRAAKLALFVINKQSVMPNSSWQAGFDRDLKTAEASLAALSDQGREVAK